MTEQADYPPLRPCPFCGSTPKGVVEDDIWTDYTIFCMDNCGAWTIRVSSKAEAADKWNRRAKL